MRSRVRRSRRGAALLRRVLALGGAEALVPSAAFTTFASANYTPDPDGSTATTLTFTVKDQNDAAMAGRAVSYA